MKNFILFILGFCLCIACTNENKSSSTKETVTMPSYSSANQSAQKSEWKPVITYGKGSNTSSNTNTTTTGNSSSENNSYTYHYSYSTSTSFGSQESNSDDNSYGEETEESPYDDYEETSNCCNGVVVYEGKNDYFVVETSQGYTILEVYTNYLSEGDMIRGELNKYNFTYVIKKSNDREVKVYIEDYMLSKSRAIEWMGNHDKLKSSDQRDFDNEESY